jgi:hypothetical protein
MSNADNDNATEKAACPFCASIGGCEHLLLLVDLTFKNAEGGALSDAFRDRWNKISDSAEGDFDERESFSKQLYEVDSLANASLEYVFEGGPGVTSEYAEYFCSSKDRVISAVNKFEAESVNYEDVEGDNCPFCQMLNCPDSGETCAHQVGREWGGTLKLDADLEDLKKVWQEAREQGQAKLGEAEFNYFITDLIGNVAQSQKLIDLAYCDVDLFDLLKTVGVRIGGGWQTRGVLGGAGRNLYVVDRQPLKNATAFYDDLYLQVERFKKSVRVEFAQKPGSQTQDVAGKKRAILIIVPNWPDGTMAMKFGHLIKQSLCASGDDFKLVQIEPERIFRVQTNVSEAVFREAMAKGNVSCSGRVLYVEM